MKKQIYPLPLLLIVNTFLILAGCTSVSKTMNALPTATDIPSTKSPIHRTGTPLRPIATETATVTPSATDTFRPTTTSPATAMPGLAETPFSLGFESVSSNNDWTPYIIEFDGVEMALVPAGCFEMGSTNEQVDDVMRQCEELRGAGNCKRSWYQDEQPVNKQCFDEAFWIDVYEVTNAQYGSSGEWAGDELPREHVNWADAAMHCKSRGARLPTEAEWEYAARGPDGLAFPWGDVFKRTLVNSCDKSCEFNLIGTRVDDGYPHTAPVGSYADGVSWVGAMDMSGNVWEWTSSIHMDYPYNTTDGREVDSSTDSSSRRVLRGGSWFHSGSDILRSATRYEVSPDYTDYVVGFRCLISATNILPHPTATKTSHPTPTSRPPLSGSGGGVLAFVRTKESGWGIYAVNADGSDERRLLFHGQALAYPEWSPDGSQIAFHKHQSDEVWSINVMDADGSNERRLTDSDAQDAAPVWSPDSSQITFTRNGDIWVMNADGSNPSLLMDDPVTANGAEWSPDGSKILFETARHGNTEIYVMESNGDNLQRLTNNQAEDWWPTWSPDGAQIAFMSTLDGDWEIYVMDATGGNLRQLTENTVDDRGPAWSPDGAQIAFVSNRDTGIPNDTEIYVMNADGSNPRRITEKNGFEWGVDWRVINPTVSLVEELEPTKSPVEIKDLQLTIIYDNTAFDERLTPEWGFAIQVEYDGHSILFDTGGTSVLLDNMQLLGIDPEAIEAVVLSHEHGDHIGGLHDFLSEANQPTVYLPERFSRSFKRVVSARTEVIEVSSSMEIFPGIYSTGQVNRDGIYEQGLAIDLGDEIVIITGCAHPGVARMTRRGRSAVQPGSDVDYKPVALVIGGFHMLGASRDQVAGAIEDLRELGVKQVSPTHCTGDDVIAIFAELLGKDFIQVGAGKLITLP